MKFKDLVFNNHPKPHAGFETQALVYFDNGYGASIVTGEYAFTDKDNPYELAILIKNKGITYSTHITDDVLGHQNESDIEDALRKIEALPPVEV